ncbi:pilus assembly protein [Ketobacter alkanivorans]|uniref:PilC beta-propeller domain-containing protein n=1 Tax=Ketobacter alkanivorans TaxID=1917421 RepID=A0A2K9LMC0_9GAMM|nr:hypothetical protein [Ketobacter alkanivorans]AUM11954.1 hypothetical protein Kalk_05745 [Ketobacter alkanivorans]
MRVDVNTESNFYAVVLSTVAVVVAFFTSFAQADDTDLFDVSAVSAPARITVVVDTSGSMARVENDPRPEVTSYNGDCVGEQVYADREDTYPYRIIGQFTIQNADRKICIVRSILLSFLDPDVGGDSVWPDNFEVGLARYGVPGGVVVAPVSALGSIVDPDSHRNRLIQSVQSLTAAGSTPLVGSYLEIAEYLTGGQAVGAASSESDSSVWVGDTSSNTRYKGVDLGPQCGITNNHLVFLTDGASSCEKGSRFTEFERESSGCSAPTNSVLMGDLGTRINEFVTGEVNQYHDECPANFLSTYAGNSNYESYWGCLSIMSDALHNHTQTDGANSVNAGVTTHVIAYDMGSASSDVSDGMSNWAVNGGGQFVAANNSSELADAFKTISNEAILPGTFVVASSGVGVNQLNRFLHLDEMYFAMFTPSSKPFWYGNLKKYFFQVGLDGELGVYANSAKTEQATDDGVFLPGVLSEWSDVVPAYYNTNNLQSVDGDIAHVGGAASKIEQPADRKLYVYYDGDRHLIQPDNAADTNEDIDELRTKLSADYAGLLADPSGADQALLASYGTDTLVPSLNWVLGVDENDEWIRLSQHIDPSQRPAAPQDTRTDSNDLRTFYGAPLHSSPALVNYRSRDALGNALTDPDDVVFISTNDGKLYAVDSDTGEEHLAYMPEAMLKRPSLTERSPVERMYDATKPTAADGGLIYGLDSSWTVWRQDVNRNGNIDEATSDFVYLYGGMRRGGRNYYILDATNVQASETISELAVLEGGTGPFVNNGQSWSEPRLAIINYAGTPTAVFIIGGGYDTAYDNGRPEALPARGAQVYIVSARYFTERGTGTPHQAGEVLWWASADASGTDTTHAQISALQYSIPSTVKTMDTDGDGYLDHFYVGDMGGQVHRFDVNNSNTGSSNLISNINDTVIAQLGFANDGVAVVTDADDRRFFYPPSVALGNCPRGSCIMVAIGSGWRSNPTNASVTEKFYMLMDYEPFGSAQPTITETSTASANGTTLEVLALSKTSDADSIVDVTSDPGIRGYSLQLGGTGFAAEKLMGSPLIVGGTAYFSTYYRPPVLTNTRTCQIGEGAAAIYALGLGDAQVLTVASGLSQNAAGSMQALISVIEDPIIDDGDGESPAPDTRRQGGLLSGTASGGRVPLNLDAIRKTRWLQMD